MLEQQTASKRSRNQSTDNCTAQRSFRPADRAVQDIGSMPMIMASRHRTGENAPLGRAVIGGLIFATASTLLFVQHFSASYRVNDGIQPKRSKLTRHSGREKFMLFKRNILELKIRDKSVGKCSRRMTAAPRTAARSWLILQLQRLRWRAC